MIISVLNMLQKLNDAIPEIKQATDRETRNAENQAMRGAFGGRGRGRGVGFAARGFAAAGLTRGVPRPNGEAASSSPAPAADSAPAPVAAPSDSS